MTRDRIIFGIGIFAMALIGIMGLSEKLVDTAEAGRKYPGEIYRTPGPSGKSTILSFRYRNHEFIVNGNGDLKAVFDQDGIILLPGKGCGCD